MSDLYSNDKIRERAERLVRNEVIYCVSHLVSELAKCVTECHALSEYEEDIYNLSEIVDYEEAAERKIDELDRDDLMDFLRDRHVDFDEKTSTEELRRLATKEVRERGGADRNFCEKFDVEPDRSEVYEHWIVSNWFADKLEAKGHPVARDFLGMTIWGRPTTGQSIAMDHVILTIAKELEEEYPS